MRAFFLGVIALIVIVAGVGVYMFSRISYTPEWFKEQNYTQPAEILSKSAPTLGHITAKLQNQKKVTITNDELASMVLGQLQQKTSWDVRKVIKGFRVHINEDKLSVESVINLKKLPKKNLPKRAREILDMVTSSIPLDVLEEFYASIEGRPVIRNGQMGFDDEAVIHLGKVTYSLRELVTQFGQDGFIALDNLPFSRVDLQRSGIILQP